MGLLPESLSSMASGFADDFSGFYALHFSTAMDDAGSPGFFPSSSDGFPATQTNDLPVLVPAQRPDQIERRKTGAIHDGAVLQGNGASDGAKTKKKDTLRRGGARRGRCYGEEEEEEEVEMKAKEVVHVRAKRGQATDSHSLAERLRREKINEKMRCLQDLVPGCYKAMGTAVLLDEIINYVQSLQNQIEFLSMKLSAASAINDFNQSDGVPAGAHGLPTAAYRGPITSSGDVVTGWNQTTASPLAHHDIFLEETIPLPTNVHQFPHWDSQ